MEKLLKLFGLLLIGILIGCSKDDPDPRASFVGDFEMEDFDVTLTSSESLDTVITVSTNPEIEFEQNADLDGNELEVDLEEFIEDVIQQSLGKLFPDAILMPNFDDEFITEITGNEFEIDDTDFTLTVQEGSGTEIFNCEFEGEGELGDGEITLEYDIILQVGGGHYNFSGEATGEKD